MVKKKYRVTTQMPIIPDMDSESELNLFDPTNPDINLFNIVDDELIRLSGSKLEFYKIYVDHRNMRSIKYRRIALNLTGFITSLVMLDSSVILKRLAMSISQMLLTMLRGLSLTNGYFKY